MKGKKLKAQRAALGLTQVQLAEILGVQPNTVARWENGVLDIPKVVVLAMETVGRSLGKTRSKRPQKKTRKT
jgi:transcriptional regulator with XRE-family HTH domain